MSSTPDLLAKAYGLHLEGKSALAYKQVLTSLQDVLPTDNFSFEGGLHRLAVVTGLATARSLEFKDALPIFIEIVTRIVNEYPLGIDEAKVKLMNKKWEGVYKDHNAQIACLRDVLHVMVEVYGFTQDQNLFETIKKIRNTLFDFYRTTNPGSFALIQFMCEEGDWEEARDAYQNAEQFRQIDLTGFIITTARMMGRAKDEHATEYFGQLVNKLNEISKDQNSETRQLIDDQTKKNTSQENNRMHRKRRFNAWSETWKQKAYQDEHDVFAMLAAVKFMGLGTQYGVVRL